VANAVQIIETKRDGRELSGSEIDWFVDAATTGAIPTYQVTAMLMAVFLRGFTPAELARWTAAMLHSGEVLDFSDLDGGVVDKHSTGGVGDKVSIPLAPLVAACGINVPMMSGRGLGHTGGTLDKMESVPGFSPQLDPSRFRSMVERHGLVLAGQSETLVPADRLFYSLRDASGTVPSIPLIASSIMSKKLAEGLDALVLDVKVGLGAFMKDIESARELATTMVGIGAAHGVGVTAFLTSMDQPLGREVGNANEMRESVDVLLGRGPEDLTELVFELAAEMLVVGGVATGHADALATLHRAVDSGDALRDPAALTDWSLLPQARSTKTISASSGGWVARCDAMRIGTAAMRLGAGREVAEDEIDHGVGISVLAKVGDEVRPGDPLAEIAFNDDARLAAAEELLADAWTITSEAVTPAPLILETIR
jgi:pyrimidine-nucleoside phosphorylase